MRCDPGFRLDTFYVNTCNFCYPFGSNVRGKGNPKNASIDHSVLGDPKVRYDTGFSIAFYINTCIFCYPFLLPLLGLQSGVKPSLRYLYWSVRTRRNLRYAMSMILTYVLLHKYMPIVFNTPLLPIFGLLSGVKPHLKLLALVIPYSGNPKVQYYIVFSLGPFNIIKFCYPCFLLTSNGDFGVKAPPQTCQQSIFGIMMAPLINPWGQTFGPLNTNNRPGLPVYIMSVLFKSQERVLV